jgi:hypothetical protein
MHAKILPWSNAALGAAGPAQTAISRGFATTNKENAGHPKANHQRYAMSCCVIAASLQRQAQLI